MRRKVLPYKQLIEFANKLPVDLIMTPRDELKCIEITGTVAEAKMKMGKDYSQLPVLEGNRVVGLLCKSHLEGDVWDEQPIIELRHQWEKFKTIDRVATLDKVCEILCDTQALLVFNDKGCLGLVHFSDLNKQGFRIFLYLWFSALEMRLAELLRESVQGIEWLNHLSEDKQVRVLGRIELDRRRNTSLDPIQWLELSDLIKICRKTPTLLRSLGCRKPKDLEKRANHLISLRNSTMHPVRHVVRNAGGVQELVEQLTDLRHIVEMLHS